jgi:hypothetical protein
MRTPKEFILSLLSREVRRAYSARDTALEVRDYAMDKSAGTSKMLDRALHQVDILTEVAEFWRKEANSKQKLFSDVAKEVDGAENLHNLKQIVREMAFRNESYGAILCRPGEDPKVIVTDERVV